MKLSQKDILKIRDIAGKKFKEFPIQAGDAFYVPFGEFHVTYNTGNQPLAMVWVTGKDTPACGA